MGAAISLNAMAKVAETAKNLPAQGSKAGVSFQQVLEKTKAADNVPQVKSGDAFAEIQAMQKSIMSAKELSGKDLILYQIKAGQFNLRVEMLSKVAEGVVGTFRKFQNPQ